MDINDLPKDQLDRVFKQDMCDIDYEFFGFVYIYEQLAKIIPKHFTVVDLGCAYNPQCILFKNHKKLISVDLPGLGKERFTTTNCEIVESKISDFIKNRIHELNIDKTFAICSYVPPWHDDNMRLVRENFKNVFTYYPHGGIEIRRI